MPLRGSTAPPPSAPGPSAPRYLVFGRSPWSSMVSPWHLLSQHLADRGPVVYVRDPEPGNVLGGSTVRPGSGNRLVEVVPPEFPLQRVGPIRRACLRRSAELVAGSPGVSGAPTVAVIYPRSPLDIVEECRPDLVVYVVTDDYSRLADGTEERDQAFCEWEDRAAALSHRILAASAPIALRLGAAWEERVRLLPMAYDDRLFTEGPHAVPESLAAVPRPVLGFAGTVRASRLDVGLIAAAAGARPDLQFVFVGPVIERGRALDPLRRLGNVRFLACPAVEDVPGFVRGFDVVIAPYRDHHMNRGYYPLKVLDGMAMGRPGVVAPAADLEELAAGVRFASDAPSFLRAVDAALAEGNHPALEEARRAAVAPRSMTRWAAAFRGIVEEALAGTGSAAPGAGASSARVEP